MKYFIATLAIILACSLSLLGMEQVDGKQFNGKFHSMSVLGLYTKVRKCPCGLNFDSHSKIKEHIEIHRSEKTQRYSCPKCDFIAHNIAKLLLHFPIHTNEIIYDCPKCKLTFIRNTSIITHRMLHEKYPVEFEYLIKNSPLKIDVHGKYKCSVCNVRHKHLSHLLNHIGLHLPSKQEKLSQNISTNSGQYFVPKSSKKRKLPSFQEFLAKVENETAMDYQEDYTLPPLLNYFPRIEINGEEEIETQYQLAPFNYQSPSQQVKRQLTSEEQSIRLI